MRDLPQIFDSKIVMAVVPCLVPFNAAPNLDEFKLSSGYPGVQLLEKSAQAFNKAASHCMSNSQSWPILMQYGPENGSETFRTTLADFLSRQYQSDVIVDELYVTTGASFGVNLLCYVLFAAGDMAFVPDPTYFLVFNMLQMCKLNLTSVSTDEQGIIPAALEEAVVQQSTKFAARPLTEDKPYQGLVYLIPTFDNPTGRCLSDERCKQIIEVARRHKLLIVCDDVYNLVYFTDKPPRRLYSYDARFL